MNEATSAAGAAMRKVCEKESPSSVTKNIGTLFVMLSRYGNDWALELSDEIPLDNRTIDAWALAIGVPSNFTPSNNKQHTIVRLTWQGTEEPAPAGSQAFYSGGKR